MRITRKIGTRLIFGFLMVVIIMGIASIYQIRTAQGLSSLQTEGSQHSREILNIKDVIYRIDGVYSVIADGAFTHNFSEAGTRFGKIKKSAKQDIATVRQLASTSGMEAQSAVFEAQYTSYLDRFEKEVLPLLKQTQATGNRLSDTLIIASIARNADEIHAMVLKGVINRKNPDFALSGTTSYDTTVKGFKRVRIIALSDMDNLRKIAAPSERIWSDTFIEKYTNYLDRIEKELLPLLAQTEVSREAAETGMRMERIRKLSVEIDILRTTALESLEQMLISLQWDSFKATQNVAALRILEQKLAVQRSEIMATLQRINVVLEKNSAHTTELINTTRSRTVTLSVLVSIIGSVVGLFIALNITRSISEPLQGIVSVADGIAHGDMSRDIKVVYDDEVAALATAFIVMKSTIQQVLQETNSLISAVQDGRFDTRGNAEMFQGGWRELVEGVNNLTDAFAKVNTELQDAKATLELRVVERTSELEQSNLELQAEMVERKLAEDLRAKLEDQLIQSQKMEAMGTLAGGVAHDFNNILTVIIGCADILNLKQGKDNPMRLYIDDILKSSLRAATLARSLLAFSRKQAITPRPVNLNEIIKNVDSLLSRVIGEDIELNTVLCENRLIVMADSGQIEQVLVNLAANARDAMPGGGYISIKTGLAELQESQGSLQPGSYAVISVSDTGTGMDEVTKQRIFEPYFTTKDMDKGTGLGLAIVYGIIKQHNGEINVYSDVGSGTTFRIYLKLTKADSAILTEEVLPREKLTGNETVLLAEDDANVRNYVRSILEEFGYTVIEAVDGEDAVRLFFENRDRIKLLVFDVVMPKKNGWLAYENIREIDDDMNVIFISGYTSDIIQKKCAFDEGMNFISKPILSHVLLSKIREVLLQQADQEEQKHDVFNSDN